MTVFGILNRPFNIRVSLGSVGLALALTRLEPDGKLDLSFANGGQQFTDFGGTLDEVKVLLRTPDGKLVLVGSSGQNLALTRYWP